jgi:hypothetical protein
VDAEVVTELLDAIRNEDPGRQAFATLVGERASRGWNRGDPSDALGEEAHAALDAALGWAVGPMTIGAYLAAVAAARARLAALRDPGAPIELATVHGAKGREWPVVVVLGQERRLAYVAVTRCRKRLILAHDPDRPSPFVAELFGRRGRIGS